jgi:multidrug efflux pump subunit AcrB
MLAALACYSTNFIRLQLLSMPGVAIPTPHGGKLRAVHIDLDPLTLQQKHLSPQDVATALAQQDPIIPAAIENAPRAHRRMKKISQSCGRTAMDLCLH